MIEWKKQGPAWVGSMALADGTPAKAVMVAGRESPKGAVIVVRGQDSATPLSQLLSHLSPQTVVDITAAQERAFGARATLPKLG